MDRTRERSRAYPGVPLPHSVENVKKIRKGLGSAEIDRKAIGHVLGVSEATAARPTAALVHFGMLERAGGNYKVSQLGRVVADPLNKEEFKNALAEAMYRPTLYSELLKQYEPEGAIPERLSTVLARHYGIAAKAAGLAAEVFMESAKYAGIVDDSFRFLSGKVDAKEAEAGEESRGIDEAQNSSSNTKKLIEPSAEETTFPTDTQEFRFRLGANKFARLSVPSELTTRDIAIIRKQIELLEMQISSE